MIIYQILYIISPSKQLPNGQQNRRDVDGMFVLYNEKTRFPVKVWLESKEQLEENCLEQAYHLSQLPFIHKWVCLMPDTHAGKGMPIGGVIAVKDVVIPNAVGVDIGCGMDFIPTNIHMDEIREIQTGNGTIIQAIGYLCIMIHSGSRHMGKAICDYFHETAREQNRKWYSEVKDEYRLAFLPVQSKEGQQYINWMNLAMDYAFENRACMLEKVCEIVTEVIERHTGLKVEFGEEINCHHNYAALENHYDANVWVHRKGATRVREGELAVIPGAMGSYSYVVEGKGNKESFCSSSHGAGRNYSRTGAMQTFSVEQVMVDLKEQGIVLGKRKKNDVPEECRFAYKDIDEVMAQQSELVTPIRKLKTVGVVKG